jgi:hypothetical protein
MPPQECHRDVFAPIKAELETWYVDNHSVAVDIKLVLLTAIAVLAPGGTLYNLGLRNLGLPARLAAGPEVARRESGAASGPAADTQAVAPRAPAATEPSGGHAVPKR